MDQRPVAPDTASRDPKANGGTTSSFSNTRSAHAASEAAATADAAAGPMVVVSMSANGLSGAFTSIAAASTATAWGRVQRAQAETEDGGSNAQHCCGHTKRQTGALSTGHSHTPNPRQGQGRHQPGSAYLPLASNIGPFSGSLSGGERAERDKACRELPGGCMTCLFQLLHHLPWTQKTSGGWQLGMLTPGTKHHVMGGLPGPVSTAAFKRHPTYDRCCVRQGYARYAPRLPHRQAQTQCGASGSLLWVDVYQGCSRALTSSSTLRLSPLQQGRQSDSSPVCTKALLPASVTQWVKMAKGQPAQTLGKWAPCTP